MVLELAQDPARGGRQIVDDGVGLNARAGAGCLGYATPAAVERERPEVPHDRRWVVGGAVAAERAEFHWFFPDCPSTLRRLLLLPPPRVITRWRWLAW